MNKSIIFVLINLLSYLTVTKGYESSQHTWTYEMKSVKTKSSNPDLLDLDFTVERVSRGVYAMSGTLKVNLDIVDGDGNELEVKTYRSANGNNDYKIIPFQLERSHWHEALNSYYKDMVMDTFKVCSDLPYFENTFIPPIEKKIYTLTQCKVSQDGLPNHLEFGYYKIVINGYGAVEWELEVVVEVMEAI